MAEKVIIFLAWCWETTKLHLAFASISNADTHQPSFKELVLKAPSSVMHSLDCDWSTKVVFTQMMFQCQELQGCHTQSHFLCIVARVATIVNVICWAWFFCTLKILQLLFWIGRENYTDRSFLAQGPEICLGSVLILPATRIAGNHNSFSSEGVVWGLGNSPQTNTLGKCSLGCFVREQSRGAWQSSFPQPDPSADHYSSPIFPGNLPIFLLMPFGWFGASLLCCVRTIESRLGKAKVCLLLTCVCMCLCMGTDVCITGGFSPWHWQRQDLATGIEFILC